MTHASSFRSGSFFLDFNVTFLADIAKGVFFLQRIKDTVNNGSLGNMTVDPSSLEIVEISGSSGLSGGAKAGIGIVVILVVASGLLLGIWWIRKKRSASLGLLRHQEFDNPIHFSSKAYDMDDPLPIPPD
ncbi:hypothetical protein AC249_AIPGENE321 [Exaiptasia diaphana]|nr:hypothetical protein AC249_AIPGENE321 [Exaiptasia diaphana]